MACRMNDNVLTTFQQQVMNYEENEHVIIKDNQKFFAASVLLSKNSARAASTLLPNYYLTVVSESVNFNTTDYWGNHCVTMSTPAFKLLRHFAAPRYGKIVIHYLEQLQEEEVELYLSGLHYVDLRVESERSSIQNWVPINNYLCRSKGLLYRLAINLQLLDQDSLESLDLKEFECLSQNMEEYQWEVLEQIKAERFVFNEDMVNYKFKPVWNVREVIIKNVMLPNDFMAVIKNLITLFPYMTDLTLKFDTDNSTLFDIELAEIYHRLDEINHLFEQNLVFVKLEMEEVGGGKFTRPEMFPSDVKRISMINPKILHTETTDEFGHSRYRQTYVNNNFRFDITFS